MVIRKNGIIYNLSQYAKVYPSKELNALCLADVQGDFDTVYFDNEQELNKAFKDITKFFIKKSKMSAKQLREHADDILNLDDLEKEEPTRRDPEYINPPEDNIEYLRYSEPEHEIEEGHIEEDIPEPEHELPEPEHWQEEEQIEESPSEESYVEEECEIECEDEEPYLDESTDPWRDIHLEHPETQYELNESQVGLNESQVITGVNTLNNSTLQWVNSNPTTLSLSEYVNRNQQQEEINEQQHSRIQRLETENLQLQEEVNRIRRIVDEIRSEVRRESEHWDL